MYKDVMVARGTELWDALENNDERRAKAAYDAAEDVFRRHVKDWPAMLARINEMKKQWTAK